MCFKEIGHFIRKLKLPVLINMKIKIPRFLFPWCMYVIVFFIYWPKGLIRSWLAMIHLTSSEPLKHFLYFNRSCRSFCSISCTVKSLDSSFWYCQQQKHLFYTNSTATATYTHTKRKISCIFNYHIAVFWWNILR